VHASLLGSSGLREVRITPRRSGETYSIRELRLTSSGPLALLETNRALQQNRLPPSLSIEIEDLEMRLFSDASELLQPFALGPGCGDGDMLGPEDFAALGMENIGLDLASTLTRRDDSLFLDLFLDLHQVAELDLRAGFVPGTETLDDLLNSPPMLTELDIRLSDQGFNQHKLQYCGERSGKTTARAIADHTRGLRERLKTRGIDIGTGLINSYARFLAVEQGDIELRLQPTDPVVATGDLGQWLRLVQDAGTDLAVNGRAVSDRRIDLDPMLWPLPTEASESPTVAVVAPVKARENPALVDVTAITVTDAQSSTAATTSNYRALPHEELDLYIGRRVIIDTVNGNQHRGVIEGFEQGRLTVRIPLQNGSVAIPVRAGGIAQIQVRVE
jgi:hypothetical protein